MRRSCVRTNWDPRLETAFVGCQGSSSALSWDLIRQQQWARGSQAPTCCPAMPPAPLGQATPLQLRSSH